MPTITKNFMWLLVLVSFFACKDDDNNQNERDTFIGEWEVTEDFKIFNLDSLTVDIERKFNLEIRDDGLAIEEYQTSGIVTEFEWYYQEDPKHLIFVENLLGLISNSIVYNITTISTNRIEMTTEYSTLDGDGNTSIVNIVRILEN